MVPEESGHRVRKTAGFKRTPAMENEIDLKSNIFHIFDRIDN